MYIREPDALILQSVSHEIPQSQDGDTESIGGFSLFIVLNAKFKVKRSIAEV